MYSVLRSCGETNAAQTLAVLFTSHRQTALREAGKVTPPEVHKCDAKAQEESRLAGNCRKAPVNRSLVNKSGCAFPSALYPREGEAAARRVCRGHGAGCRVLCLPQGLPLPWEALAASGHHFRNRWL